MFTRSKTAETPIVEAQASTADDIDKNVATDDRAKPWARLLYDPPRYGDEQVVMEDYLPAENLVDSYATQWYRFQYMGRHFALRPQSDTFQPFNHLWSAIGREEFAPVNISEAAIIGYCHPGGVPSLPSERSALRERAVELIRNQNLEAIDIVAIQSYNQGLGGLCAESI